MCRGDNDVLMRARAPLCPGKDGKKMRNMRMPRAQASLPDDRGKTALRMALFIACAARTTDGTVSMLTGVVTLSSNKA